MDIVGTIRFGSCILDVYRSLDEPLFRASDIANVVEYSDNVWRMLQLCEEDEKLKLPIVVSGQTRQVSFVTEMGLYNIFAQSRKPLARIWRRVVHAELIRMRKESNMDISQQFDKWNEMADPIYFDEETGQMMQSITIAGGDVIQVPYKNK